MLKKDREEQSVSAYSAEYLEIQNNLTAKQHQNNNFRVGNSALKAEIDKKSKENQNLLNEVKLSETQKA